MLRSTGDRLMAYGRQLALLADPIDADWVTFHQANPHVYAELVRLARGANIRGQKLGIGCLWETLRYSLSVDSTDPVKLNNSYRSRYSRLIMANEPDLAGYFDTRTLRSEWAS